MPTPWWDCSECGYKNGPHAFRKDNTKCEQCGHERDPKVDPDRVTR